MTETRKTVELNKCDSVGKIAQTGVSHFPVTERMRAVLLVERALNDGGQPSSPRKGRKERQMSDSISRADVFEIIDKAFSQPMRNGVTLYADICLMLNTLPTHANSRSTHERDLISRANAIRWVKTECNPYGKPTLDYDSGLKVIEHLKKMPSELPSAEAVQGWRIGKPTEQGKYMVTIDSFGHKRIDLFYYGKPLMPNRKVRGKCWHRSDDEWGDVVYDDTDILAWQPLPKPYKGGDTE